MSAESNISDGVAAVDIKLATHYALRVALQTMKERCLALQERLANVEEENISLRNRYGLDRQMSFRDPYLAGSSIDTECFREKVSELTRQKSQLSEHIAMVSKENRQLWSRLSQLTKEKDIVLKALPTEPTLPIASTSNLIRSKTFTQHSPNPLLRHKTITVDVGGDREDLSLEEVSLKGFNEIFTEKLRLIKNDPTTDNSTANSLGFTYLNDDTSDADTGSDPSKCNNRMNKIKTVLLRQQNELKLLCNRLKQKAAVEECAQCKHGRSKPETADKSLETDEELFDNCEGATAIPNIYAEEPLPPYSPPRSNLEDIRRPNIDILEQKREADSMDRMCPMCAKVYLSMSPFDEFMEHVESHFIDDSELEQSMEKNIDCIPNSILNF